MFTVHGDPVPKGRPRVGRGRAYTPKRTLDAEQAVRDACGQRVPFDVPVRMDLVFCAATRRRTDLDNMAKLTADALNKIVYTDDYLIEQMTLRVARGCGKDDARTDVHVSPLTPGDHPAIG